MKGGEYMKQQPILYGIAGLVIGVVLTGLVMANQTKEVTPAQSNTMTMQESMQSGSGMDMSMQDMMTSMNGKTGEEFDKAFISGMIEHHTGAINMAKEAQMNAGREEIKTLAGEIITAQEKEIEMMRQWQKDWGFTQ